MSFTYKIYSSSLELPPQWNRLASKNIFLNQDYLAVLELAPPVNMVCHFIAIFNKEQLVGIALTQFIDLSNVNSLGDRDHCFKTMVKNFIFKKLISNVLIVGNNMLTGQNCYAFDETISEEKAINTLNDAVEALKKQLKSQNKKVHLTVFKDFDDANVPLFNQPSFKAYYRFTTQPNMVLGIRPHWHSIDDYIADLSKKYRDQYKRAHKKAEGISKRKMPLNEIMEHQNQIYQLYLNVAQNAPFNTFYLSKNHFEVFKKKLKDNFLFYGYFIDDKLIGFNTLIKNGSAIDTYFLGYDSNCQREKMLYLNMLYDMVGYSINKKYEQIIFARTALEIKSSVGALPIQMTGLIKHENYFLNLLVCKCFAYFEPKTDWIARNPFK